MNEEKVIETKDIIVTVLGKVDLGPAKSKPSKCHYGKVECQNHHICSILGQCAKSHSAVWRHKVKHYFYKKITLKKALEIFEPIMPLKVPIKKRKRYE